MGSKTVMMNPKEGGPEQGRPAKAGSLGIQSDVAFSEAAKRLNGRDLCSIADLTVEEMAAVMELAHAVKSNPDDFRHALDGRQMVLFFEKASLRTRLTFEAAMNTLGGNAIFVDQTQSPLGERESIPDMAHNIERWMSVMVLRTYSHDTITEMAACSRMVWRWGIAGRPETIVLGSTSVMAPEQAPSIEPSPMWMWSRTAHWPPSATPVPRIAEPATPDCPARTQCGPSCTLWAT